MKSCVLPLAALRAGLATLALFACTSALAEPREAMQRAITELATCARFEDRREEFQIARQDFRVTRQGRHIVGGRAFTSAPPDCEAQGCNELLIEVGTAALANAVTVEATEVTTRRRLEGHLGSAQVSEGAVTFRLRAADLAEIDRPIARDDLFVIRFYGPTESVCVERHSPEYLAAQEARFAEKKRREEIEQRRETIYRNCVIAKSERTAALDEVRAYCRDLARDPGWFDRWRWGG